MATPADETDNIPVSLSERAPIGPISERSSNIYLAIPGLAPLDYKKTFVQTNACIRSQMAHSSLTHEKRARCHNQNVEATTARENMKFPYPADYQKLLEALPRTGVMKAWETGTRRVYGIFHFSSNVLRQIWSGDPTGYLFKAVRYTELWLETFSWIWFSISRTSVIELQTPDQPVYVVLGIFHRGYSNPQEWIAFVPEPARFFRELQWAVFRLRGLSGAVLSLRQVKSFRLYRVCTF